MALFAMRETYVRSLGWEDPLEEGMATHSSILAGESHGQRSLGGYSPCGLKESTRLSDQALHGTAVAFMGFILGHKMKLQSQDR